MKTLIANTCPDCGAQLVHCGADPITATGEQLECTECPFVEAIEPATLTN